VEVGLGGRLDATHAWDGGVAVVTNVDLDHMDRLGPTIAAIAREKAAIIERGDLAVTGAHGEALEIVRRRARRMAAPLTEVRPAPLLGWDRDGLQVVLPRLGEVRVGLRGRHQAANVAVADGLLDALEAAGIATVDADARRRGYANAVWPGRLELLALGAGREVLLDGAHNPAGAAALAGALDDLRPFLADGPLTLVLGMMADKDVDGAIDALLTADSLRDATVITTSVDAARAMPAPELAARWTARSAALAAAPGSTRSPVAIETIADPIEALAVAMDRAGPTVVAGSLYLVGAIRAHLVDDPALRDPAPSPPSERDR
ncbi:MAG: glutamate ligase domain-containing protein, partial [Candidatus Limnocylindrales bacterium]